MTQDSRRLQHEIDFIDKIRAVREILTAALEGQIDDPEAIAGCGKILDQTAHRLQICRNHRPEA